MRDDRLRSLWVAWLETMIWPAGFDGFSIECSPNEFRDYFDSLKGLVPGGGSVVTIPLDWKYRGVRVVITDAMDGKPPRMVFEAPVPPVSSEHVRGPNDRSREPYRG